MLPATLGGFSVGELERALVDREDELTEAGELEVLADGEGVGERRAHPFERLERGRQLVRDGAGSSTAAAAGAGLPLLSTVTAPSPTSACSPVRPNDSATVPITWTTSPFAQTGRAPARADRRTPFRRRRVAVRVGVLLLDEEAVQRVVVGEQRRHDALDEHRVADEVAGRAVALDGRRST